MLKKLDGEGIVITGVALLLISAILYAAFTSKKQEPLHSKKVLVSYGVNVYCDKETNIEYLIYVGDDRSGFTVRYNRNGKIRKCNNKKLSKVQNAKL